MLMVVYNSSNFQGALWYLTRGPCCLSVAFIKPDIRELTEKKQKHLTNAQPRPGEAQYVNKTALFAIALIEKGTFDMDAAVLMLACFAVVVGRVCS